MQNIHGKEIDLLRTTVKVPGKRLPRATPATAPGTSPRANGLALERSNTQLAGGAGEVAGGGGGGGCFSLQDGGAWLWRPIEGGAVGLHSPPACVLRAPDVLATQSPAQPSAFAQVLPSWELVEGAAGDLEIRMGPDSLELTGTSSGPGAVSPQLEPTKAGDGENRVSSARSQCLNQVRRGDGGGQLEGDGAPWSSPGERPWVCSER